MTNEIGHRHKQVERLPGRKQAGAAFGRPDRGERIPDQSAKHLAAKRRREPSCADEAREFHLDLFAGLFRHGLFDGTAFATERHPGNRLGPEFGEARQRPGIGIKQLVNIGRVEPQICQRIQRLTRENGLSQKYPIDPACAGPGDNVR